ncbi:MAG: hypothetical protein Q8Q12_17085 [bacterium]|nr:hypothetical protein [bacterium]
MKSSKFDAETQVVPVKRRGLFRRRSPARKLLRLRASVRSPYSALGSRFGVGRFLALAVFALGMAYVEAACVVYLWEKVYPEGFAFPLPTLAQLRKMGYMGLLGVELGRELATIVMLVGVAMAAGRTKVQRIASFLFLFGVWDILYYGWLRVITECTHFPSFPASFGTWDVLFLIPVVWTAPVYAPMVVAATMVLFAVLLVVAEKRGPAIKADLRFWIIEGTAVSMIFASLIWNYRAVLVGKAPTSYPWWLLFPAEIIGVTAFLYLIRECFSKRT